MNIYIHVKIREISSSYHYKCGMGTLFVKLVFRFKII